MEEQGGAASGASAGRQGRSEAGWRTNVLTVTIQKDIPWPRSAAGNLHATLDNTPGIPGSSPSAHPLKKIGRAAPVGLGYREKKRYRSPLVSL